MTQRTRALSRCGERSEGSAIQPEEDLSNFAFRKPFTVSRLRDNILGATDDRILLGLSRLQKYRRAQSPDGREFVRSRGKKGGRIVHQTLSDKVLKPLKNRFCGLQCEYDGSLCRVHKTRNTWFAVNARALSPIPAAKKQQKVKPRKSDGSCQLWEEFTVKEMRKTDFDVLKENTAGKYRMGKWLPDAVVCRCSIIFSVLISTAIIINLQTDCLGYLQGTRNTHLR